ncbi:MAG TPA: TonB family protein [Burkholderiales bacterium]|nr:TonB family protein [Burkholderiales bacterium]
MFATTAKSATASRWAGLGVVLALHAAVIGALLQHQPVRDALASVAPIMVSLIAPPKVAVAPSPKPPIDLPKPKPHPVRKLPDPPPLIAAPVDAPSPIVAPAPPPEPPKEAESPPPPTAIVAPEPPVTPPSFMAAYLDNPAPAYPAASRRMREEGKVVLRVLVSAEGLPEKVELRTSSGSARLDGAALEAVQRWKFVPARQGDRPVAAWVLVPISFTLQG